jgi:hypothetical protein
MRSVPSLFHGLTPLLLPLFVRHEALPLLLRVLARLMLLSLEKEGAGLVELWAECG